MKLDHTSLIIFLLACLPFIGKTDPVIKNHSSQNPLYFEKNDGQYGVSNNETPACQYSVNAKNIKMEFYADHVFFHFYKNERTKWQKDCTPFSKINTPYPVFVKTIELAFLNSNKLVGIHAMNKQSYITNYYIGCRRFEKVSNYSTLIYYNIYPSIDLKFYFKDGGLEYEFVVRPGGMVSDIKLSWQGNDKIKKQPDGALKYMNPYGLLHENAPFSYQDKSTLVASSFELHNNIVCFKVGNYDHTKSLTIDPSLKWSTYFGGTNIDLGGAIVADKFGHIYTTGSTLSTSAIASTGAYQTVKDSNTDIFIAKYDSLGTKLWSTYYGGSGVEMGTCLSMDKSGKNILVGGWTNSATIADTGHLQSRLNAGRDSITKKDAFILKFDSSGSKKWCTFFGGANDDQASGIAVDDSGSIYLSGNTKSDSGIASLGSFIDSLPPADNTSFLAKLDSNARTMKWGTYFGYRGNTTISSFTISDSGYLYICGITYSDTLISSFGQLYGDRGDAFVAKFNKSNDTRIWGLYFGDSANDAASDLKVAKNGDVYVAGSTCSGLVSPRNPYDRFYSNNGDAFLLRLNGAGNIYWWTFYGDTMREWGISVCIDTCSHIYLTGQTYDTGSIATLTAYDTSYAGNGDVFMAVFDSTGARLWATYFGGASVDMPSKITADNTNNIYLIGNTQSNSGIGHLGAQNTFGGIDDAFIIRFKNICP